MLLSLKKLAVLIKRTALAYKLYQQILNYKAISNNFEAVVLHSFIINFYFITHPTLISYQKS